MALPSLIRHNIGLKLASVLLGIVIYLHVYTDQVHDGQFWLPIQLVRQPDSLALMGEPPTKALVLLRGRGKELIKLKWRSPVIEVDASTAAAGRFYHAIGTGDVLMPAATEARPVAVVEPRLLVLDFDRVSKRVLPVRVELVGDLPPGYVLRGFRVEPREVVLGGPSQLLPAADTLRVGPVELRAFRGRAQGLFPVRRPHPKLLPEPPEVLVEVAVERAASRELADVAVAALADSGFVAVAAPGSSAVRLEGLRERVEALAPGGLRVVVDARGLGPGEHTLPGREDTVAGVVVKPVVERFQVVVRVEEGAEAPVGDRGPEGGGVAAGSGR